MRSQGRPNEANLICMMMLRRGGCEPVRGVKQLACWLLEEALSVMIMSCLSALGNCTLVCTVILAYHKVHAHHASCSPTGHRTSDPTARGIQLNGGPAAVRRHSLTGPVCSTSCDGASRTIFSLRAAAFGSSYIQRLEPLVLGLRVRNNQAPWRGQSCNNGSI